MCSDMHAELRGASPCVRDLGILGKPPNPMLYTKVQGLCTQACSTVTGRLLQMGQGEVTLGLCRTRMAAFTYCPLCMALWQTKAGAFKWTPVEAGALAFSLPILAGPNKCIGLTKNTSEGLAI